MHYSNRNTEIRKLWQTAWMHPSALIRVRGISKTTPPLRKCYRNPSNLTKNTCGLICQKVSMNQSRCLPRQGSQVVTSFDWCSCNTLRPLTPTKIALRKVQDSFVPGGKKIIKNVMDNQESKSGRASVIRRRAGRSGTFGFVAFQCRTSLISTFLSWLMFYQHRFMRKLMHWHWQEVVFGKFLFSLGS